MLEPIQQHVWRMGNGNWKHHKPKLKVICLSINIIDNNCISINYWEVYFLQHTGKPNSDNVPALISVSCVAVVASVLMFIIGFVCGHCFGQRRKKLTQHEQTISTSTAAASNEQEGDLELKDNVAYVTLHPK